MDDIPVTVRALERLLSVMYAFVDGESTRYRECLTTSWKITPVRFCRTGVK